MEKTRFFIYPDRVYVLDYDGKKLEVTGQEILLAFRREAIIIHDFLESDQPSDIG